MSLVTSTSVPMLLFAAFAALSLAGCGLTSSIDGDTAERTEANAPRTEPFPPTASGRVDVDTDNGAIDIEQRTT